MSTLQSEIRQRKPFRSRGQEPFLSLLRTADVVRRPHATLAESHGVTLQQYNVLRILRGAGAEGLPTLAIGQRMIEQTPGVTRLLDRLEAKGWVRRERCKQDRRQVLCWITQSGRTLLQRLDRPMDELVDAAFAVLSDRDLQKLIRLLSTLRVAQAPEKEKPPSA